MSVWHKRKTENETIIYYNGKPVYKRWHNERGEKLQNSILFNVNGWHNEWLRCNEELDSSETMQQRRIEFYGETG